MPGQHPGLSNPAYCRSGATDECCRGLKPEQDKCVEPTPRHPPIASCGLQLRDSCDQAPLPLAPLDGFFFKWSGLLFEHLLATASCAREGGEAAARNKPSLFVHSGILYLNDDFQGGGLFFTEMDTVTVTVSLGLTKRREE